MPNPTTYESPHAASCEAIVRAADFDRYLAALFVPIAARSHIFALYAFQYEVAHTAESVSQPIAGQIRLQWWRDAVAGLYAGRVLAHPVVAALGKAIDVHRLPRALFDGMIDARESDLEDAPFSNMPALEAYADFTSGNLMRLAARVLGACDRLDSEARAAGIAYALTGLLRAVPFHAARGRVMLPLDALGAQGLSVQAVGVGKASVALSAVIAMIAKHAREHYAQARRVVPRRLLPALLPAALVPLYLRKVTRPGFDSFRDRTDVAVHRRQLAMLAAMGRGHV